MAQRLNKPKELFNVTGVLKSVLGNLRDLVESLKDPLELKRFLYIFILFRLSGKLWTHLD